MRFFIPRDMMKKGLKFYTPVLNNHYQIFFKIQLLRNTFHSYLKKNKLQINQYFSFSCLRQLVGMKKYTIFLVNLTFIQLVVHMMILLIIQPKINRFYHTILTQEIQLKGRLQEKLLETF